MGNTSITSPKGAALREEVLSALSIHQPQTVRQLYEGSAIAINQKDISSIMKAMIDNRDIIQDASINPGEPGGMLLARGAKPVASYRLKDNVGFHESVARPPIVDDPISVTTTAEVDPLIMQLASFDALSKKTAFEPRDVGLLRGLATTNLISTEMPDWSLYLLGLADRIEESI